MARSALVLARYMFVEDEQGLGGGEQFALLNRLKDASPIAYRKTDPSSSDYDTYMMTLKRGSRLGTDFVTFQVCRDISFRQVRRPDRKAQTIDVSFEDTDDCELARLVLLPRLGVLAAEDGSGAGKLGGWPSLKRLAAIVREHSNAFFDATAAGTPQDLKRAIETWDLERFSFQARPFNPHPSTPGQDLSDLLKEAGVGDFRGTALPHEGGYMNGRQNGIISEAVGLSEKGYATYGATARTPSGAEAVVKKQSFSQDRHKNLESMRGPQQLRVYIEHKDEKEQIRKSVDVLLEFFAQDDKLSE